MIGDSKKFKIFKNYKELTIAKIFLLFSVLLITFSAIAYIYFSNKISSNEALSTLEKQAQRIEKSFDESIEYSSYFMNYLGSQISNHNYQDLHFINNLLKSFKINPQAERQTPWNMFSWADVNKKILVNSDVGILLNSADISDRDYFKKIKEPGKLYFGKATIGRISNKYIIPSVMQINKGNHKVGFLIFGFQISKLEEKLSLALTSDDVSFAIFDYEKNLVLKSKNFSSTQSLQNFNEKFLLSKRKGIESQDFEIFSSNNDYGFLQKIEGYDYVIFVKYANGYLGKNSINKIFTKIFIAGCILLFLLAILLVLKFTIIRPILELAKNSKEISSGNLNTPIFQSRIQEISQLSQSISSIKDFIIKEREAKRIIEKSKKEAEKANDSKIILLRSIAHDIKNYIFGISGLAKILLDKKLNEKEKPLEKEDFENIQTVISQTDELTCFVEDLLDTNQIENGEFRLGNIGYYDVAELINRMRLLNQGLAIKYGVSLETEVEENIPPLKCDIRRVKQVLTNLISNAIKYNKKGGIVKITAKYLEQEKEIYFEIYDSGIGLSQEEIEAILSENKLTKKYPMSDRIDSHGLGMQIALFLLKLHNAKIFIDSKKGKETKIRLYFSAPDKKEDQQETSLKKSNNHEKTILLVEDNQVNIKITSTILDRAGYKVMHAYNGEEALKLLDNHNFDLILMDGEMPVMNGYETTKLIRSGAQFKNFRNFKKIPIIGLMSCSDVETIKKSFDSGMNDHIEKGRPSNVLIDAIHKFLE